MPHDPRSRLSRLAIAVVPFVAITAAVYPATPVSWDPGNYHRPMTAYPGTRVNAGMLLGGYAEAVERFRDAAAGRDPLAAFRPLFESLNWAVALDDYIGEIWRPDGKRLGLEWRERLLGAESMSGLRYVRNRVHHQWADALRLDEEGRRYPRRYPIKYFEWVWRDLAELPPAPPEREDRRGRERYVELLEGAPAEVTLHILGEVMDEVWRLLEFRSVGTPGLGFGPGSAYARP
jgi:hypothetical protein